MFAVAEIHNAGTQLTLKATVGSGSKFDGITDIIWRHKTSGQNDIWLVRGNTCCKFQTRLPWFALHRNFTFR
ncbi:MAG: hypothetical protein HQL01_12140 [Nitrospirae bacterium]|nr:hypothetical protein [Nitrospirota bacterium]